MQTGQLAKAMEKGDQERAEEHLEAEADGFRARNRLFLVDFSRFRWIFEALRAFSGPFRWRRGLKISIVLPDALGQQPRLEAATVA